MGKRSKKMKRNTRKNKKVFVGGERTNFSSEVLKTFLGNLTNREADNEQKMIDFYRSGAELDNGNIPTTTSTTSTTIQSRQTDKDYGEWQMYIQDLIMALKNFTPSGAGDENEKRKTAIFILQKLNDINLWDQFQRTFFTGYVDNLDTSERDNYTKETKIVMSTVPNLFHMFDINDRKLSDRKKLTNTHFRVEEKFKNGSKFLNEINNVEERILLMRLLSSGDPETLKKIDNYKKNSQEKEMNFTTSYPFLSNNNNIEKFQSVGGRKTKKRSKLKN